MENGWDMCVAKLLVTLADIHGRVDRSARDVASETNGKISVMEMR